VTYLKEADLCGRGVRETSNRLDRTVAGKGAERLVANPEVVPVSGTVWRQGQDGLRV
jgi:hypothetical protein